MSSTTQLKGGLILEADSTRFVSSIQKSISSLQKMDTQVSTSSQKTTQIGQAAQRTEQPLNRLSQTATQTGQKITQMTQATDRAKTSMSTMGSSAGQASAGMNRIGSSATQAAAGTSRLNANSIGTAASIGTMGAGIVALEASMSNYTKATFKVEKAELGVQKGRDALQKTQTALLNAENMLKKARDGGKKTAEEMQYYEEQVINYRNDLKTKTEDLTLKQEKLNIANMDYADTQKLMATSIATTLLGTLSSASMLMQGMGNSAAITTIKTKAMGLAARITGGHIGGSIATTKAATGANILMGKSAVGATGGLRGMAMGIKTVGKAFLTNPIGMAIMGITAAIGGLWAMWDSNFLGIRDGIHDLIDGFQGFWEAAKKLLWPLEALEGALKSLGINIGGNIDQWQEYEKAERKLDDALKDGIITQTEYDQSIKQLKIDHGKLVDETRELTAAEKEQRMEMGLTAEKTDELSAANVELTDVIIQEDAALADLTTQTDVSNASLGLLSNTAQTASANFVSLTSSTLGYKAALSLLPDEQNNYTDALGKGKDALVDVESKLKDTKTELMALSSQYVDASEKGPAAMHLLQEANGSAVVSMIEDWVSMGGTLDEWMITLYESAGGTKGAFAEMTGSSKTMSDNVSDNFATMAGNAKRSLWDIQKEVTAFTVALKKNENDTELTIRNILNGFKTMTVEAQKMYESAMIANANHILSLSGRGDNTSVDSLADALTITEQARTGNWANPTHSQGVGANMQHHGPPDWSNEMNRLLKAGIYVPHTEMPSTLKAWRKSHSTSWKNRKRKTDYPSIALWENGRFVTYAKGTQKHTDYWELRDVTKLITNRKTDEQRKLDKKYATAAYKSRSSTRKQATAPEIEGWISTGLTVEEITEYLDKNIRYEDYAKIQQEKLEKELAEIQRIEDEKREQQRLLQEAQAEIDRINAKKQLEAEQQQRKQEQQAIEQRAYEADKSLYDKIKKIILEIMPTAQIPEMQQTPTPPPQQQQNNDRLNRDLQILLKSLSDAESHGDLQNIIGMHQKLETYYAKSGNNERYYYHKKQRHKLITELETQQQQDLYHEHGDQLFQLTQSLGIDQNSAEFDHYLKNNPHLFETNQWVQTERGKTYQEFMKLYNNVYGNERTIIEVNQI